MQCSNNYHQCGELAKALGMYFESMDNTVLKPYVGFLVEE
jgi:hypothetical protein